MTKPVSAKKTDETVWGRIERRLAGDIARGARRPGERLATEHALARRFNVNRHTVRQALASLAAKGMVRVERGRGTFVQEFALDYALGRRTRFSENLAAAGREGRHRLTGSRRVRASGIVARALGLRAGALVVCLETVAEVAGRPVSCGEHYFAARRFSGIADAFAETGSITRALRRFGVADYTRKVSHVTARLPDGRVAALLKQTPSRPVIVVESVNVDARRRPVEYGCTQFSGDLVQLVVESGR